MHNRTTETKEKTTNDPSLLEGKVAYRPSLNEDTNWNESCPQEDIRWNKSISQKDTGWMDYLGSTIGSEDYYIKDKVLLIHWKMCNKLRIIM